MSFCALVNFCALVTFCALVLGLLAVVAFAGLVIAGAVFAVANFSFTDFAAAGEAGDKAGSVAATDFDRAFLGAAEETADGLESALVDFPAFTAEVAAVAFSSFFFLLIFILKRSCNCAPLPSEYQRNQLSKFQKFYPLHKRLSNKML